MKTEITRDRLSEFFTPTLNWQRNDGKIIDYAEIEIKPDGIKRLEENLDRCIGKDIFSEEEFKELNDANSDIWEDVVCYVHFEAGTENLDKIYLSIRTPQDEVEINADKILTVEEKHIITDYALELIRKARD